jgi:hypothetical protein
MYTTGPSPLPPMSTLQWRVAQRRTLARFCARHHLDLQQVEVGEADTSVLAPILDEWGEIIPEPRDVRWAARI